MMDFSEAWSFNDGIEFYGKDIIIIATRKDDKEKIEKVNLHVLNTLVNLLRLLFVCY